MVGSHSAFHYSGVDGIPAGEFLRPPAYRIHIVFDNDPGASFTAVVQLGTEAAGAGCISTKDIFSIIVSWFKGLVNKDARDSITAWAGW